LIVFKSIAPMVDSLAEIFDERGDREDKGYQDAYPE
jgi:hypothetical protein